MTFSPSHPQGLNNTRLHTLLKYGISQITTIILSIISPYDPFFLWQRMNKERESEGQIAAAPSLFSFLYLLSLPPSLSPSTFHSCSSTFAFVLLSPVSPHLLHPPISLSFFFFAPSSSHSPLSFPISFSWLTCLVCHTHVHIRAACKRSHAHELTHLCYLPSVPQVITSQTRPHKHHINPAFELTQ